MKTLNASRSRHRTLLSALAALLTVWSATAIAQSTDGDASAEETVAEDPALRGGSGETQIFIDRIDVNVVNVEVYVTDKRGNRVSGLKKEDFKLYEDRRLIAISNFYAVEDGRPASPPAPDSGSAEPRRGANETEVEDSLAIPDRRIDPLQPSLPEDQQLHLIVYFDNLFLKPFSRNRVIHQVRQFLHDKIRPGDRVMLVTFDRALHIRTPFTSNMRLIADELYEVETLSGFAEQAGTERRDVIRRIESAEGEHEAEGHIDLYAKSLHHDVTITVRKLRELVGSLAGLPGRKVILHVSDGIPMTPAEDLFLLHSQRWKDTPFTALRARQYNLRREFRELTAQANANRVTFYTLEARGLRSHTSLSAEYDGGIDVDGRVQGSRIEADILRTSGHQETLQMMALETGGLATINTNNISGAFENMAADFRSYYSLGYVPAHSGDGRYHQIEVKVEGKGLKVRHRAGYRDKSSETYLSEITLAALLYGVESNPMDIELRFSPPRLSEKDRYLLPMEVRVPLSNTTLIPRAEVFLGRLRFSVAVIDDQGRMSPVRQTPVPLTIPSAEIDVARQQVYVYDIELLMRRGDQQVAVAVRDEMGAVSSYIRRSVRIGT